MINLSGSRLGQYDIIEEIGHGGMANVYRATQPSVGRTVAVKVLPTHFLQDRTFLERFNREVRVIAGLQHPHILPVYDFGEHDGIPFIVMAYMPGGSLADVIAQNSNGLPLNRAVRLVEQIADALDYAHERGIIHRDFKPGNVLLDTRGNPYLADFGIAKVTESTAQLTGGGMVGTPGYMAPEMMEAGGVTPQIDVYALGVTLFQMLTGRVPYEADTPMGVLMAHANKPIPDARQRRPDLPDAVQAVIERAMAKDPADRYPSAGALADDLRQAAAGIMPAERPRAEAATVKSPKASAAAAATMPDVYRGEPTYVEEGTRQPYQTAGVQPAPAPSRKKGFPAWLGALIGLLILVGIGGVAAVVLLPGLLRGSPTPTPRAQPEVAATQEPQQEPPVQDEPTHTPRPPQVSAAESDRAVAVVLDSAGENDRGFNEYTLKGARQAAQDFDLPFEHAVAQSGDYTQHIERLIDSGYDLIITVGFLMVDATSAAAQAHPDVRFVIVDGVIDAPNVTSLVFAEDEAGYLAGVLAGCMTETNIIGSVAGMEIPPVQRFVFGYQNGARSVNPGVEPLNIYTPSFNDPAAGQSVAEDFIAKGADVIFGVGGSTGNGGLLAAHLAGIMAIGVDVDQYYTYPEVARSLMSSAAKNMDIAALNAVRAFAEGNLQAGTQEETVANGGVGLAPYHDWEFRIPPECKDAVEHARQGLADGTVSTGVPD